MRFHLGFLKVFLMNYKCLYANGDSWTEGDEIGGKYDYLNTPTVRYYNSWPWFLSQELNIGVCVNDGANGRSNYRIFRRTIKFIFEWIENGKKPSDLIIVNGWTTPERFELPVIDKNGKGSYTHLLINMSSYDKYKYDSLTIDKINQFSNLFYELVDINELDENMVNHMRILRIITNYFGITYFDFIAVGNHPNNIKLNYKDDFSNLFSKSFLNTVNENKWSTYERKHPTIETHKKWATLLKNFIDEYNL